ncbi:MAG TPA: hypothetical protein VNW06_05520, partial [Cytophagaceae bacterium]|nr:hypothetical protein [Cytophagaceae bacterium]
IKALKIYTNGIGGTSLTNTNEITYCVDRYNQHYTNSHFIVAGLYQNKQLIGYCQFMYISEEKLIIIDYIIIDEAYRGLNVFYSFVEKVKEFIQSNDYEVKYLVGEINIQNNIGNDIPQKAKMLIKLLKTNNFGEIKCDYFQPMLGVDNYESEQKSILMLYPANEYIVIKKETYIKIIETIYFKHYERWYKLFLSDNDIIKYNKHINELFRKVSEKASSLRTINVEQDEDLYGDSSLRTKVERNKTRKSALLIFGFIGLLFLLITIALILKIKFKLELKDQFYLLAITSGLYLALLAVFSEKAATILNKLLEKIVDKIT